MNVLIVNDDKVFIRKVLEGVDWSSIGVQQVFSAESMSEACKTLKVFPVDIVVTDIEMVGGNGIELLRWISKEKCSVETLVVSGYTHFEYVQKTIENGCKQYLLKHLSVKEINVAIDDIIKQKIQNSSKKSDLVFDWKSLSNNTNDISHFINELNRKRKICKSNVSFCVAILQIFTDSIHTEIEQRLLMFMLYNVIKEFVNESLFDVDCIMQVSSDQWCLVFRNTERIEVVRDVIYRIQSYLVQTAQVDSCFYIGKIGNIEHVFKNFKAFYNSVSEMVFTEQGIILQSDLESMSDVSIDAPNFKELENVLDSGDSFIVHEILDKYIQQLAEAYMTKKSRFKEILQELDGLAHRFVLKNNLDFYQIFDKEQYESECLRAIKSVQCMKNFVKYLIKRLDGISDVGGAKKQVVDLLKWYIKNNISKELTRKRLAQIVHFSEDYVARLFKKETGKSISLYVLEQRMELAKSYISESNRPISDIALAVGYQNFSYFSKTFKDYTGKTPNEYRVFCRNLR